MFVVNVSWIALVDDSFILQLFTELFLINFKCYNNIRPLYFIRAMTSNLLFPMYTPSSHLSHNQNFSLLSANMLCKRTSHGDFLKLHNIRFNNKYWLLMSILHGHLNLFEGSSSICVIFLFNFEANDFRAFGSVFWTAKKSIV